MENQKDIKGWISLHRNIKDHWLWKKNKVKSYFEAWIDILITVNHEEQKVCIGDEIIVCKRGQSIQSMLTWGEQFGWDRSKVKRFLKLLESDSMIHLKPTTKTTILTVCNYDTYQNGRTSNEHQMNIKRTSNEHQMNINNNVNNINNKKEYIRKKNKKPIILEIKSFKTYSELEFINEVKSIQEFKIHHDSFINYWTESSPNGKMKFQLQTTWETKRRLITWNKNNFSNKTDEVYHNTKRVKGIDEGNFR